jgi:predicted transcriptional regulator
MEVSFSAEMLDRLARVAAQRGSDSGTLVVEAVERMLDYDEWFLREVDKGLRQIEQGRTLSHEEVGTRLQNHLAARNSRA